MRWREMVYSRVRCLANLAMDELTMRYDDRSIVVIAKHQEEPINSLPRAPLTRYLTSPHCLCRYRLMPTEKPLLEVVYLRLIPPLTYVRLFHLISYTPRPLGRASASHVLVSLFLSSVHVIIGGLSSFSIISPV